MIPASDVSTARANGKLTLDYTCHITLSKSSFCALFLFITEVATKLCHFSGSMPQRLSESLLSGLVGWKTQVMEDARFHDWNLIGLTFSKALTAEDILSGT